MNELIKLGENTYVITNPVNVGIYVLDNENVCLIDTGSSKDYGKLIKGILKEKNWNLKCIINTHSHADHISANKYLQNEYNCEIYSSSIESYFINEPILEPAFLYGASPLNELCNHFLMAKESGCKDIKECNIEGLNFINLEGHSAGLIGVLTKDSVCFVGDAYVSEEQLIKHPIQYIYDVEKYLKSLEYLKNTKFKYYVPSHGVVETDCTNTIETNYNNTIKIEQNILDYVSKNVYFHELIAKIFDHYHINLNITQHYLISTTIKAYLTKLSQDQKIEITIQNGDLLINKII